MLPQYPVQTLGAQILLPVTLAQLSHAMQTAVDGEVMIHGKDMKTANVRFVGRILGMEEVNSTQIVFSLHDGTHRMNTAWFIDTDENDFVTSRRNSWQYVSQNDGDGEFVWTVVEFADVRGSLRRLTSAGRERPCAGGCRSVGCGCVIGNALRG